MAAASKFSFGRKAAPFMLMMAIGSWGLSQLLKMPIEMKDARARERKLGKEKFDLNQELEVRFPGPIMLRRIVPPHPPGLRQSLTAQLKDESLNYENQRVPGPRPANRRPAD